MNSETLIWFSHPAGSHVSCCHIIFHLLQLRFKLPAGIGPFLDGLSKEHIREGMQYLLLNVRIRFLKPSFVTALIDAISLARKLMAFVLRYQVVWMTLLFYRFFFCTHLFQIILIHSASAVLKWLNFCVKHKM